jgi:hypothetical protein
VKGKQNSQEARAKFPHARSLLKQRLPSCRPQDTILESYNQMNFEKRKRDL